MLSMREQCSFVLVAGDVFDRPNPHPKIKDHLVEQLLPFSDFVRFIFFVGNHDYTTKSKDYHSINYLKYFEQATKGKGNIYIVEPGESIYMDDLPVPVSIFGMDEFGDLSGYKKKDGYNIITWHGIVPGIDFSSKEIMSSAAHKAVAQVVKDSQADYLAMGDIHQRTAFSTRCAYSGPPVQKGYADTGTVDVVTLTPQKASAVPVSLNLPKKVFVAVATTNTAKIIAHVRKTVRPGNIVRLAFSLPLESWAALDKATLLDALQETYSCTMYNRPTTIDAPTALAKELGQSRTTEQDLKIIIKSICDESSAKDVYTYCTDLIKGIDA